MPTINETTPESKAESKAREDALFAALAALNTPEDLRRFMMDLCTPKEVSDFAERWLIARMLYEGSLSYREISAQTGASTTTVGRVARFLQQEPHQGYKLILERGKPL